MGNDELTILRKSATTLVLAVLAIGRVEPVCLFGPVSLPPRRRWWLWDRTSAVAFYGLSMA